VRVVTRWLSAAVSGALGVTLLAACGGSTTVAASFGAHGSVEEAYVTGAPPGAHLTLVDAAGTTVGGGVVNSLGGLVVRNLTPGAGYRFEQSGSPTQATAPFTVLSTHSAPSPAFYAGQHLHVGLNYVTMRDGVQIAATVRLPLGKTLADGPFPTVIEYSGYATAAPHSLIDALLGRASSKDPLLPDTATVVGAALAPLLGFAAVSVQLRGTGCSGGAFDLFGLPSDYDGYDVVQTVGSQSWVLHHKVGLVGISYSGLSQFMVAGTDPPDLAAITPLSPTDDLYSTGYPGGIYNNGFAKSWTAQRVVDAEAAPRGGQPWAKAEIAAGDKTCLANQVLHPESEKLDSLVAPGLARDPALFDRRSPAVWATHVTVPVFVVGALEDEQTGPQWPALITALRRDPTVYATMLNGTHIDSLGPDTVTRWLEFLDIYVAGRVPTANPVIGALAPALYAMVTGGAKAMTPPAVRFTDATSVTAARAAFAAQDPRVRVLFDNGGGSAPAGAMWPAFEAGFPTWPPAGTVTRWDLASGGALTSASPSGTAGGAGAAGTPSRATFHPDPAVRPATDLASNANAWAAQPPYNWTPVPAANGAAFQTSPFTADTTIVGPASLDLWMASTAPSTDLQVTVTEVRPGDAQEEYVTSGFLRSSDRTLGASSTALDPLPTYLGSDRRPLPRGRDTLIRVPIDPIAHVFRAGTSLRIVITAPGGDRPSWAFDSPGTQGSVTDSVALGGAHPSSLAVNVVRGVTVGAPLPACGALRGEPCRPYAALANQAP
jgi:predicted acyl esterase